MWGRLEGIPGVEINEYFDTTWDAKQYILINNKD